MNARIPRVVTVGREGRITLPAAMREALELKEGAQVLVQLDASGRLQVSPVEMVPRDPSWLSQSKAQSRLEEQAAADVEQGRITPVTEKRLEGLSQPIHEDDGGEFVHEEVGLKSV